jgi:hypothetical protein
MDIRFGVLAAPRSRFSGYLALEREGNYEMGCTVSSPFGSPAASPNERPVALRARLATGLPFSGMTAYTSSIYVCVYRYPLIHPRSRAHKVLYLVAR